ncbi:hypothetical protein U3516DRAFT_754319 [Neocallimastix sp. 'constans']
MKQILNCKEFVKVNPSEKEDITIFCPFKEDLKEHPKKHFFQNIYHKNPKQLKSENSELREKTIESIEEFRDSFTTTTTICSLRKIGAGVDLGVGVGINTSNNIKKLTSTHNEISPPSIYNSSKLLQLDSNRFNKSNSHDNNNGMKDINVITTSDDFYGFNFNLRSR